MQTILVTGATGNVGQATLQTLASKHDPNQHRLRAGVRKLEGAHSSLPAAATPVLFDFEDPATFPQALQNVDTLFLLRPPQLSDVKKYFAPLVKEAKRQGVKHVVFLSVQGVEKSSVIPHHKIEKFIAGCGVPYTFLRPGYFMQNLTTTLQQDLVERKEIFLPAGEAKFNFVDVQDIGSVAAEVLLHPEQHQNKAYDLTGPSNYTFREIAAVLSDELQQPIRYTSPNPLRFYLQKRRQGIPAPMVLVMIMLHFLPRFQAAPPVSDSIKQISGFSPTGFRTFVQRERKELLGGK